MREAKLLRKLPDRAPTKVDAARLGDDAFEVDPTPAHELVLLAIGTRLDDLCELSQLLRRKARRGTVRPVVDEALRSRGVEAMDPVAQGLAVHAADIGRRAAVHSVADRSQRQKPPALVHVLRRRARLRSSSAETA
jgi:hypothetical protein